MIRFNLGIGALAKGLNFFKLLSRLFTYVVMSYLMKNVYRYRLRTYCTCLKNIVNRVWKSIIRFNHLFFDSWCSIHFTKLANCVNLVKRTWFSSEQHEWLLISSYFCTFPKLLIRLGLFPASSSLNCKKRHVSTCQRQWIENLFKMLTLISYFHSTA